VYGDGSKIHRGFTAAEKTELWDRWKRGESLKAIGRAVGKLVAPHGGIRPALRRRSRLALTLPEREVICRGVTAHQSARSIAKVLGRSPSTVSRQVSRNGGYDRYRAALADEDAWARSRRPKCYNWQTVRGYGGQWRGSSDWIGRSRLCCVDRLSRQPNCGHLGRGTIGR
jgi:DNA-binding CsgD family transcriptional regulator